MAMKVMKTPEQTTEKWIRRAGQAVQDVIDGVKNVEVSPAQLAVAKQDKMRANLVKAIDSGRWANGLKKVSLSDWQNKTIEKVQTRYVSGVEAAASKRAEFDKWMYNKANSILPKLHAMPDASIQDSAHRVVFWMTEMSKDPYKGKK